jgi:hypothetical protein
MNKHLYRWTCVGAFSLATSSAVIAQSTPMQNTRTLSFKSTLSQYKPYTDEKTVDWKAANDDVGKIGGWRTYLKQANEPDKVEPDNSKSETPKPNAPSTLPPSSKPPARATDPHAGHGSK